LSCSQKYRAIYNGKKAIVTVDCDDSKIVKTIHMPIFLLNQTQTNVNDFHVIITVVQGTFAGVCYDDDFEISDTKSLVSNDYENVCNHSDTYIEISDSTEGPIDVTESSNDEDFLYDFNEFFHFQSETMKMNGKIIISSERTHLDEQIIILMICSSFNDEKIDDITNSTNSIIINYQKLNKLIFDNFVLCKFPSKSKMNKVDREISGSQANIYEKTQSTLSSMYLIVERYIDKIVIFEKIYNLIYLFITNILSILNLIILYYIYNLYNNKFIFNIYNVYVLKMCHISEMKWYMIDSFD